MLRHLNHLLCALVLGAVFTSPARAELVTYNFNAPQFTLNESTPLLNRAPNIGLNTFLASFTSAPRADAFVVSNFQPNPLFSGPSLVAPQFPDTLTLAFNMPVDSVRLDFAVIMPGVLILTTPVGGTTQASMNVGGGFPGGTLAFSSVDPFSTLQLRATDLAGAPIVFAIDNLTLNTAGDGSAIPEPSSLMLLSVGVVSAGGFLRWRRTGRRALVAA